jgi:peptidoglycan/LPS O-acetylase OafA/YrhL
MVLLPIHVVAGLLSIAAGAVALYAIKGAPLHRKSGLIFVAAMLTMASTGAIMAVANADPGTALGGAIAFYVVCTGLLTVKRTVAESRGLLTALMLMALAICAVELAFGTVAAGRPDRMLFKYPAGLYYTFSVVTLLFASGDARTLWRGSLDPVARLARHIVRMCFAMWFATTSFFLGQAKVFPEPLRHMMGVRAIPVVLVIVVMIYWLVRIRSKRTRPMRMLEPAR